MLSVLMLLGCASTPDGAANVQDGVIHLSTGESDSGAPAPMSMQERIRQVFLESQVALVDCYRPALERDPMRYGEVVVGVSISPTGEVTNTEVVFSTIAVWIHIIPHKVSNKGKLLTKPLYCQV